MFGIGMPEMLLILAVALIVFGPKRLPELAKSLGRALGEFKRATSDLKQSVKTESGLDEVRESLDEVKKDVKSQIDLPDATETASSSAMDDRDESLSKVKAAFDQMNRDTDSSAQSKTEAEPEAESDAPADPDTRPQEKPVP